ncbi:hypothetical protein ERJ75_000537600 [Trypanosoma vivax]|uniref:Uncharacterized protein n=1 Tax=Trypanosoma vivax (strain Y486) TaxID=1055687 RepID=F9WKX4_TRYVY|nr:hypothetical protein TRVL_01377 [Trypanosoma vivax]KAH8615882.1 hypothetical protein ERJ75_000537600 [Trypanosoma vivax]CCD18157.1 hypothetical protein, conserved [Trypanosoma vivax Y486]|eukprot:CCD18157.1 hypothetical protein, conserved [Trypanosoma vivax Y486]
MLNLNPHKWPDTIAASPDCLLSPESAKNVENVLSMASVKKHQKELFKVVVPHAQNMLCNRNGISILTSLVSYGTTTTVDGIATLVLQLCDKILACKSKPDESCVSALALLVERIIYRCDCIDSGRLSIIGLLKSLKHSDIMNNPVLLLATAQLMTLDRDFAHALQTSEDARNCFFNMYSSIANRSFIVRMCNLMLSKDCQGDDTALSLNATFVYTSLRKLYESDSPIRPCKQITLLLSSCNSSCVSQKLARHLALWPDIYTKAKDADYAKIIANILISLQNESDGISLVKAIIKMEEDIDQRLQSRKASQLLLLTSIGGNEAYVKALTKELGESQRKKLSGANVLYMNITKPRATSTKEALLQRLAKLRATSLQNDGTTGLHKRYRV